jgi:formylglycine-generating enzyme required for sulfatase activity
MVAVGLYPTGASQQEVWDLVGNAWEWCFNQYENLNQTKTDSEALHVVRGGSYSYSQKEANSTYRYFDRRGNRWYFIGFRLVCVAPILKH